MKEIELFKLDTSKKMMVPLYGDVMYCGTPGEVEDIAEIVDLNDLLKVQKGDTFLGIVYGDSMIEAGFRPGDILTINREREAKNGDTVVAFIDGEFTVKYYHHDKKKKIVTLVPANDDYDIIRIDLRTTKFSVWGIVEKQLANIGSGINIIRARMAAATQVPADENAMPPAIDESGLRKYFKASFKGIGSGNFDCIPMLIATIDRDWTAYKHAMIAKLIYESPHMTNKPNTYAEWYRKYCTLVGCAYHSSYKPTKVNPTKDVKEAFAILA